MRFGQGLLVVVLAMGVASVPAEAQQQKPPYYASISAGKARMRTGPGRNYPANWFYQRADLPVRVVDVYQDWRKIEDPDGTQGWMLASLLSRTRTAMVRETVTELHDAPRITARVNWRAAPGVVGRISKCNGGWCWLDIRGRGGFIEQSKLWGVDPNEELP